MLCTKLDRLEARLMGIRAASRISSLTAEQQDILEIAEYIEIGDVKDHQAFGHDGDRCFGE